jgi:hypothetical protein
VSLFVGACGFVVRGGIARPVAQALPEMANCSRIQSIWGEVLVLEKVELTQGESDILWP